MPFGCTGSVFAWDGVAATIAHVARVLLPLPVLRYVDDYFAVARPGECHHAMTCFARLVRAILGPDAIAANKLIHGNPTEVLGLDVSILTNTLLCSPSADKLESWISVIDNALANDALSPADAEKLAGRLMWAGPHMFFIQNGSRHVTSHLQAACGTLAPREKVSSRQRT